MIIGSLVASGNLRRLAVVVLSVLSLAVVGPVTPGLAEEGCDDGPAQVVSETQGTDEELEEGSAWYPPAGVQGSGQGGTGPLKIQEPGTVTDPEVAAEQGRKPPSAEWVIAPIPFSNPTIGTGLILAPAYIFPMDPDDLESPPSTVGLGVMYSNNGSKAAGLGGRTYSQEDRHRASGGIGYYDVKYDFFGIGNEAGDNGLSVPLRQRGRALRLEYLQLWRDDTYFGARYSLTESRVSLDVDIPDWWPDILPTEYRSQQGAIGLVAQRDTRDSTFYPREGIMLETGVDLYGSIWGSDFTYQAYEAGYNSYRSLDEKTVLASRAYARQVGGDVPFYGLSMFGLNGDLRGYTAGQYRDKLMIALQAEYRRELKGPWGYVAFLGVGEVAPRLAALNFNDILPSGGVGLRYTLAEQNHVNMRIDFAYGKEGGAIHFGAGEAF